jgi:hypothetical protein
MQQTTIACVLENLARRITLKKTSLFVAAAVISLAAGTAGFAAELPTYQTSGLPMSSVQVQVLGAADLQQQAPAPASALTPVQLSVLTPRTNMTTAGIAPARNDTARSIH